MKYFHITQDMKLTYINIPKKSKTYKSHEFMIYRFLMYCQIWNIDKSFHQAETCCAVGNEMLKPQQKHQTPLTEKDSFFLYFYRLYF